MGKYLGRTNSSQLPRILQEFDENVSPDFSETFGSLLLGDSALSEPRSSNGVPPNQISYTPSEHAPNEAIQDDDLFCKLVFDSFE